MSRSQGFLCDSGWEKVAQRLGYTWNSPCRQVFSPGRHFHLSSQDCPHLPPACHRFPRSLEKLPRGGDPKPGQESELFVCQKSVAGSPPPCKQPTLYSFCTALALWICCTTWRMLWSKNQKAFVAKTIKTSDSGVTWGTISPSNQSLEGLQSAHLKQSMENVAWCALLPLKLFLQNVFKNLFSWWQAVKPVEL